ncbi:MAG: hypothetical protein DME20_05545 [Verrucomicrobia bacterium]|nr:MAG: hypothetical protein DME20_05545 [Verrucomicrobiota bacterium]
MSFRAVIFDLDGVLADSEPWWNEIDKKLLAEYGVTYRGEYHRNVLGVSYRLAVEFYKKAFGLSVPTEEDEIERGKPHPDIYLRAAEKLGLVADECLVIEDAFSGIAAAKAAKMRVAAIPDTRFVDPRAFEKEAASVLGSLSEIPALVRRIGAAE